MKRFFYLVNRSFFLVIMLSMGPLSLQGQSAEEESVRLKQSIRQEDLKEKPRGGEEPVTMEERKRGRLNMSVGSSFTYMKGYGSLMGSYAAPTYTLPLNNRWSLHGGIIASSFTGLNMRPYGEEYTSNPTMNSLALFGAASYRMTDWLILHGAGVKHLVSTAVPPLVSYPADNFSLGATYKLGDNVSIGASLHMNRGHGSYYGSPFRSSYFHSPPGW